jgi:hypothetical protein
VNEGRKRNRMRAGMEQKANLPNQSLGGSVASLMRLRVIHKTEFFHLAGRGVDQSEVQQ